MEKEVVEFFDIRVGVKEVQRIISPIVMARTDRAELINERYEKAMRKLIQKYCSSGQSRQKAKTAFGIFFLWMKWKQMRK